MKIFPLFPLIALSGCQTTQPVAVDIAPLSAQIERSPIDMGDLAPLTRAKRNAGVVWMGLKGLVRAVVEQMGEWRIVFRMRQWLAYNFQKAIRRL